MRIIRKVVSKMERNLHIHCPEDVDRSLFARLFSSLVVGDDLDDLIFNGEEWYKSERTNIIKRSPKFMQLFI